MAAPALRRTRKSQDLGAERLLLIGWFASIIDGFHWFRVARAPVAIYLSRPPMAESWRAAIDSILHFVQQGQLAS